VEGKDLPVVTMTRRMTFNAAHRYHRPEWSEARNREVFGACVNTHGHNYTLEVSVRGPVDPPTGMLFNMTLLKQILEEEVRADFDHVQLDRDVVALRDRIPTCENLARALWDRVAPRVAAAEGGRCRLAHLRLFETEKLFVEIGEGDPIPAAAQGAPA
jgi:6-pyruvoyltetrahydropterin/6-carboxytetrahydropterin synthase